MNADLVAGAAMALGLALMTTLLPAASADGLLPMEDQVDASLLAAAETANGLVRDAGAQAGMASDLATQAGQDALDTAVQAERDLNGMALDASRGATGAADGAASLGFGVAQEQLGAAQGSADQSVQRAGFVAAQGGAFGQRALARTADANGRVLGPLPGTTAAMMDAVPDPGVPVAGYLVISVAGTVNGLNHQIDYIVATGGPDLDAIQGSVADFEAQLADMPDGMLRPAGQYASQTTGVAAGFAVDTTDDALGTGLLVLQL
jgi:hypothetical protein